MSASLGINLFRYVFLFPALFLLTVFHVSAASLTATVAKNTTAAIHIRVKYDSGETFRAGRCEKLSFNYLGKTADLEVYLGGTTENPMSVGVNFIIKECENPSSLGIGGMVLIQGDYIPAPGNKVSVCYYKPDAYKRKDNGRLASWIKILPTDALCQKDDINELSLTLWMLPTGDMTEEKISTGNTAKASTTEEDTTAKKAINKVHYTWSVMHSCLALVSWSKTSLDSLKVSHGPSLELTANNSTRSRDKHKLSLFMKHQAEESTYPYNGWELACMNKQGVETTPDVLPWKQIRSAFVARTVSSGMDYTAVLAGRPEGLNTKLILKFHKTNAVAEEPRIPVENKCCFTQPSSITEPTLSVLPEGDDLLYACLMHFNPKAKEAAAEGSDTTETTVPATEKPVVRSAAFDFHDKHYEMSIHPEGDETSADHTVISIRPHTQESGEPETTKERGWEGLKGFVVAHHPVLLGPEAKVAPPCFVPFLPEDTTVPGNYILKSAIFPATALNSIMNHDEFIIRAVHHPVVKVSAQPEAGKQPFQSALVTADDVSVELEIGRFDLSWPQNKTKMIDPVCHAVEGGEMKFTLQANESGKLKLYIDDIPPWYEYFNVSYWKCCDTAVCSWSELVKVTPSKNKVRENKTTLTLGSLSSILQHSAETVRFKIEMVRSTEE